MVTEVYNDEKEIKIKFLHPKGPASFYWLEDKDICTIPLDHLICSISTPTTHGSGNQLRYKIK